MNKTKILSPEQIFKRKKNIFNSIIQRIYRKIYYFYLEKKYHKNSEKRILNIDWKSKNFNRIALINYLLNKYQYPNYLEIGCASNDLFDSLPISQKTGVDPHSGGNIRSTSDDFFKNNESSFDIIFIDGLHTYDQVRKDILNSINTIKKDGWIALHDMLPRNWKEQHIPYLGGAWTGDVWKVAFEIIKTEGLDFKIISIDHGVGIIKVKNKNAKLKDFKKELKNKQFNYFIDNYNLLPVINWEEAISWIN